VLDGSLFFTLLHVIYLLHTLFYSLNDLFHTLYAHPLRSVPYALRSVLTYSLSIRLFTFRHVGLNDLTFYS